MRIRQKLLLSGDGHAARRWHRFGHGDQAVRHTEAWEHENFAEEQARWERSDPEYARICEQARQATESGEEASWRADQAKAKWDARVAIRRQTSDDAQRAQHALNDEPTEPARRTLPHSEQAALLRVRGPATRNPVSNESNKLEVE